MRCAVCVGESRAAFFRRISRSLFILPFAWPFAWPLVWPFWLPGPVEVALFWERAFVEFELRPICEDFVSSSESRSGIELMRCWSSESTRDAPVFGVISSGLCPVRPCWTPSGAGTVVDCRSTSSRSGSMNLEGSSRVCAVELNSGNVAEICDMFEE